MKLEVFENEKSLSLQLDGKFGRELELLFWGVLDKICDQLKINRNELVGTVLITNDIPLGAGLGASASFCVLMAKVCENQNWISAEQLSDFARNLENLFHGESSGVDISVMLAGRPLIFTRSGRRDFLQMKWQPKLAISYSGQKGLTADCIKQVKKIFDVDAHLANNLDQKMQNAANLAEESLSETFSEASLQKLIQSINSACICFDQWGLSQGAVAEHIQLLKNHGALAVKPTGSGGGGFILSLWNEKIPKDLGLISCF